MVSVASDMNFGYKWRPHFNDGCVHHIVRLS